MQDTVREAYLGRVEGARRGHSSMQFYRDAPFSGLPGRDGGVGMGHGSNNFKNKAEVSDGHPWHPDPQVRNRQPCRYHTCRAACSVVHQMTVRGAFHPWRRVPGAEMWRFVGLTGTQCAVPSGNCSWSGQLCPGFIKRPVSRCAEKAQRERLASTKTPSAIIVIVIQLCSGYLKLTRPTEGQFH